VTFRYGERRALDEVALEVATGEIFGFLGPNGSGKTTLFRLLSTLIPLQKGQIEVLGRDVRGATADVRREIGVVFQAPSVDMKLTVAENLRHQGWLYGLRGADLKRRSREMLEQLGLADRSGDLVETLSGGLRRRVEIAKGLLHSPRLLLLDEPSTGLDPAARSDLWSYLRAIRQRDGVTVVLTTHLLDEAERCDRLAILNQGELVALDSPDALRAAVGGETITIRADQPDELARDIGAQFDVQPQQIDGSLRLQSEAARELAPRLMSAFGDRVRSLTLARPTLEDAFIARTGHRFWSNEHDAASRELNPEP
jgi:ABC-2 type transport system ATP-binding protein